ncbi:transcriptional regulator, TetR family [Sphingomonas laterariae]|uniref:Transcriptional regulator, TetR family n=1 Tax=Edaphosphingomonas laterariae TaxID=861865 RepID=A0A239CFF5_9SPHN|nr:TetR/AcrR family transcriptional regulator [Sphingomonas laterariae]SNS18063.1 transcriptional regulator, TetR family [Sphingomonas laterariae]
MPRPVTYDRDAVIAQAARSFWESGFAACDVEALTRSAGVNRHSLYKAFGGKIGLFHAALGHYLASVAAPYLAILEAGEGVDDVAAYFERATGATHGDGEGYDRRGCLIVNTITEMGRSDPDVAAIVDGYHERIERAFAGLIARGQAGGTIRADLDPVATARWLFVTSQGLSVAARMGRAAPDLPAMVRAALAPIA